MPTVAELREHLATLEQPTDGTKPELEGRLLQCALDQQQRIRELEVDAAAPPATPDGVPLLDAAAQPPGTPPRPDAAAGSSPASVRPHRHTPGSGGTHQHACQSNYKLAASGAHRWPVEKLQYGNRAYFPVLKFLCAAGLLLLLLLRLLPRLLFVNSAFGVQHLCLGSVARLVEPFDESTCCWLMYPPMDSRRDQSWVDRGVLAAVANIGRAVAMVVPLYAFVVPAFRSMMAGLQLWSPSAKKDEAGNAEVELLVEQLEVWQRPEEMNGQTPRSTLAWSITFAWRHEAHSAVGRWKRLTLKVQANKQRLELELLQRRREHEAQIAEVVDAAKDSFRARVNLLCLRALVELGLRRGLQAKLLHQALDRQHQIPTSAPQDGTGELELLSSQQSSSSTASSSSDSVQRRPRAGLFIALAGVMRLDNIESPAYQLCTLQIM